MSKPKLLIVEDDPGLCAQYRWAFPACRVLIAGDRRQAEALLRKEQPAVALLDLGLPPDPEGAGEGFATLAALRAACPALPVVVATGQGQRENALRAISLGAYDFCVKPVDLALLRIVIDRALRLRALEEENLRLAAAPKASPIQGILTADAGMLKVCRTVERLGSVSIPVLLLGESGTGKEALARALHEMGPRAGKPFVAINCAAIPEALLESELFGHEKGAFTGALRQVAGKVEMAHGGTLFLDEIGEMPTPLQAKLLRFLQDGCFRRVGSDEEVYLDVRVICATQVDLSELCAKGEFRQDLYHRLNVLSLHIPPLRECLDGLAPLVEHFLDQASRQIGCPLPQLAPQAMDRLGRYHWPGNVRQLENVLFQAVSLCEGGTIKVEHIRLPDYGAPHPLGDFSLEGGLDAIVGRFERAVLERLYREHPSSRLLGKRLGVSHTTIANKLRQHGLGQGGES